MARARCSLGRASGNGLRVLTQAIPAAAPVHALLADLRTGGECLIQIPAQADFFFFRDVIFSFRKLIVTFKFFV